MEPEKKPIPEDILLVSFRFYFQSNIKKLISISRAANETVTKQGIVAQTVDLTSGSCDPVQRVSPSSQILFNIYSCIYIVVASH